MSSFSLACNEEKLIAGYEVESRKQESFKAQYA